MYCQRGRYESDGLCQFESGGFKCLWLVRIPEINCSLGQFSCFAQEVTEVNALPALS